MFIVAAMSSAPRVTIALPTADRRAAHAFLRDGLGFPTPGRPAEDGVPEPLRATLGEACEVMLVPADGFSTFVTGRPVPTGAGAGSLVSLDLPSRAEVDARFAQAVAAGGEPVTAPGATPWGLYRAIVADPDGHLWQLAHTGTGP